jgi:ubiquinone/menaquinone biosynthesis C-methylase UbiE
MNDKYQDREEMEFTVMDACNLEHLPDACFDLVIDKAMFDSQLCSATNLTSITSLTSEMHRVLKPGGTYLVVSYGLPPTRMGYLTPKGLGWAVEYKKMQKPMVENSKEVQGNSDHHFLYACRKKL